MTNEVRLDHTDRRILAVLQQEGRRTYAEIGARVGLSAPSVHERVKKLESRGVITGYAAQVDAPLSGYGVLAFVLVIQDSHADWDIVSEYFRSLPEIIECHHVAGEEDFLLKIRARDTLHLERVLRAVQAGGRVDSTRTMVVLSTPFENRGVPMEVAESALKPATGDGRIS